MFDIDLIKDLVSLNIKQGYDTLSRIIVRAYSVKHKMTDKEKEMCDVLVKYRDTLTCIMNDFIEECNNVNICGDSVIFNYGVIQKWDRLMFAFEQDINFMITNKDKLSSNGLSILKIYEECSKILVEKKKEFEDKTEELRKY